MALTSGSKTLPGTSVRQRDGPLCLYPYLDKKYIAALRKSNRIALRPANRFMPELRRRMMGPTQRTSL